MMEKTVMDEVVKQVMQVLSKTTLLEEKKGIPVGVSNRHIHLSAEHIEILFGSGHTLTRQKDLKQVGEFAAAETVTMVGPKGVIRGVRVLGPVRKNTQVEISRTDGFSLGVVPPLRDSGDIAESAGITIVGSHGAVTLTEGLICATRHIHMHTDDARRFGVSDGERVKVEIGGSRGASFKNVLVRVHPDFRLEFHIDTDEANAVNLKSGDEVTLSRCEEV
ncbi:phosphate propanoyltransferase [Pelosinus sp. IPA-1]|uniref:phosphate propanoyltransferase n=1 Tax=Pelosinus sp. IPA-1 TaxID=3029569 RepID=UPI0025541A41|nr:phosphate propanoyltransferase [Pelosinus sp. IPA-1]